MSASVVFRRLRLNRHEPPCAGGLECDACCANSGPSALGGVEAVNVPKQRLAQISGEHFRFNDAATKLASPLWRVFDADRRTEGTASKNLPCTSIGSAAQLACLS